MRRDDENSEFPHHQERFCGIKKTCDMESPPNIEQTSVQLLVSHQAALQAFVLALLPENPDAGDVVQEVNAAAREKRGEFDVFLLTGQVDEIALWNRPPTAAEALQQFRSAQGKEPE
jgi:DNA-directed RNA polymerase specialized sigma24 family protein